MSNRILVNVVFVSILSIAIGLVGLIIDNQRLTIFLDVGEVFFVIVGVYLLVVNGEFIKTREYKIARGGISIFIVGILFKILHYPLANELIGIGFLWFIALYLVYMIKNKRLQWNNYLKILLLLALLLGKYFGLIHAAYSDEISIAGEIILAILLFDFIKANKLYMKEK